jgi:riboflavin kinase/FMN adenylyltransferase
MDARTALTIGVFDGAHIGHADLIRRARVIAGPVERGGRVVVMAFDPHPLATIRPEAAPVRLTTFEHRRALLLGLGADEVVRLEPTRDLLSLTPEAFIERMVEQWRPAGVVEGEDFRFGRARAGDVATLHELGSRFGFEVEIAEPVLATLSDQLIVTASSSMTRWLLGRGRVRDASIVLGRPHEVTGIVVRGARRGRGIGCPTANLRTEEALPADGVYAGVATLADGRDLPAAISVGTNPTFGEEPRSIEAHLLDPERLNASDPAWRGPLAEGGEEYGWPMSLRVVSWLRDQIAYDRIDDLTDQIRRDVGATIAWWRRAVRGEDAWLASDASDPWSAPAPEAAMQGREVSA